MVQVDYTILFKKKIEKIRDHAAQEQIEKCTDKIIANPESGKPMRYARKDTRELYVGSFRLSYCYIKEEDKIVFLDLYHKKEQ